MYLIRPALRVRFRVSAWLPRGLFLAGLIGSCSALAGTASIEFAFEVDTAGSTAKTASGELTAYSVKGVLTPTDSGYRFEASGQQGERNTLGAVVDVLREGELPAIRAAVEVDRFEVDPSLDSSGEDGEHLAWPVPFHWLDPESVDLRMKLRIGELMLGDARFRNALATVAPTTHGESRTIVEAHGPGGQLKLVVEADAANEALRLDLNGADLRPGHWPWFRHRDEAVLLDSIATIDFFAAGAGATVGDVLATMAGNLHIEIGEGRLSHDGVRKLGTGIVALLMESLNPFRGSKADVKLECAVIRSRIDAGVATLNRSLALETGQAALIASGLVDLRQRELELMAYPSTGGGLTPKVGDLAGAIHIHGPLFDPTVSTGGPDPIRLGATIATGGQAWLIRGLLERLGSRKGPCEMAREADLSPALEAGSSKETGGPGSRPEEADATPGQGVTPES